MASLEGRAKASPSFGGEKMRQFQVGGKNDIGYWRKRINDVGYWMLDNGNRI